MQTGRDFESLFERERLDLLQDGLDRLLARCDEIDDLLTDETDGNASRIALRGRLERIARRAAMVAAQLDGGPAETPPPFGAADAAELADRPADELLHMIDQSVAAIGASITSDGRQPDVNQREDGRIASTGAADHRNGRAGSGRTAARKRIMPARARETESERRRNHELAALIVDVADDIESFLRNCDGTAGRAAGGDADDIDLAVTTQRRDSRGRHKGTPLAEPYVSFLGPDHVGLSLSGGGIRSATFNLGLLQGLHSFGVLDLVDYLSTVSGGGYIGGWWSAWRLRSAQPGQIFPARTVPEAPVVRHLREFSKFLSPRAGFFSVELWYGLVAIIGGLLPTLFLALLQLLTVMLAWLIAAYLLLYGVPTISATSDLGEALKWISIPPQLCELLMMALLTILIEVGFEWPLTGRAAARRRYAEPVANAPGGASRGTIRAIFAWVTLSAATLAACLLLVMQVFIAAIGGSEKQPARMGWQSFITSISKPVEGWGDVHWTLLAPAAAWLGTGLILLLVHTVTAKTRNVSEDPARDAAWARGASRLLALALVWTGLAAVWEIAAYLVGATHHYGLLGVGGGALAGSEIFRQLRNWMSVRPSEPQTGKFTDQIRPLIPQIVAYGVLACVLILISGGLESTLPRIGRHWSTPLLAPFATAGLIVLICWVLDPHAYGLHDFYRGRIARSYLGASNRSSDDNRETLEHVGDDITLSNFRAQLKSGQRRPIHLICCAANDLAGDELDNLGRGSQSATISRFGVQIADAYSPTPGVTLGAALTASAAAFNSQMGTLSREFGPAVAFLMSAMNLRLGRWLEHPAYERDSPSHAPPARMPGHLLLREFWSLTHSGVDRRGVPYERFVHLSDGAHFENLGLYELVRRHCRYIIVSDCGADPDCAFDDLGNAIRRIRDDFGVEIELDVSPLKPVDERAAQHAAVGTIHYDERYDKGILIYFKPALTGDEPDDVSQYKTRNKAFPHETTADQFYDEAQWESYRRLGEHSARSVLRFVETSHPSGWSRYSVFTEAYWRWYPTPAGMSATMLEQTARYTHFLESLRTAEAPRLARELFAELGSAKPEQNEAGDQHDLARVVPLLLEMAQVLEDAFIALRLGTTWNHPLNAGWMAVFYRWTRSEAFQSIWPLVQPLFSREFREFLNDRMRMRRFTPGNANALHRVADCVHERKAGEPPDIMIGLAGKAWMERDPDGRNSPFELRDPASRRVFTFDFPIKFTGHQAFDVQLGMAIVQIEGRVARWSTEDLVVAPWVRGGNIHGAFVEEILRRLIEDPPRAYDRVVVKFDGGATATESLRRPLGSDEGSRAYRAGLVRLYKSLGFKLCMKKTGDTVEQFLVRVL